MLYYYSKFVQSLNFKLMKKFYYPCLFFLLLVLSGSDKIFSQSRPNILLVLIDDGRYQDYAPTGGPSWFQSPAINSIAEEGVNFKSSFVVLSLCEPSRVSILTGQYAHNNGFITNAQVYDTSTLTIARILRNNGYFTGISGKFINTYVDFPSNDFSWYFAYTGNGNYNPKKFNFNGKDTLVQKNVQQAMNEFAVRFLESVPADTPFFLIYSAKSPHVPYTAYPGYAGVYHVEEVALPSNFNGYVKNYPNFLYYDNLYDKDSAGCINDIQTYYETLAGVESGVDSLLTYLKSKNILDSTLVIYMSDNGIFIGEHHLDKKRFAYEESIRIPLFMRYPKWFAPGTVVEDQFAQNIDLFPTILDAAGIEDNFNDDGISLRKLADGSAKREVYMCEYFYDTIKEVIPAFRAIRDFKYKYIRYFCNQQVEEFFDLTYDIKEDSNLIFRADYQDLINIYRIRLDSLRIALGDTFKNDTIISCNLLNADTLYLNHPAISPMAGVGFYISPNPAKDALSLYFNGRLNGDEVLEINSPEGRIFKVKSVIATSQIHIETGQLPSGLYLIRVKGKYGIATGRFVKIE